MKFKIIILFTLYVSLVSSCISKAVNSKISANDNINATLKSIIINENADFYKKDINAWCSHFVKDSAVQWLCVEDNVTLRANGWNDLYKFVSDYMVQNPKSEIDTLTSQNAITNFRAIVADSMAYVIFTKSHLNTDKTMKQLNETRVLKKVGNEWKILAITSSPAYLTPKSSKNIFIHGDAL